MTDPRPPSTFRCIGSREAVHGARSTGRPLSARPRELTAAYRPYRSRHTCGQARCSGRIASHRPRQCHSLHSSPTAVRRYHAIHRASFATSTFSRRPGSLLPRTLDTDVWRALPCKTRFFPMTIPLHAPVPAARFTQLRRWCQQAVPPAHVRGRNQMNSFPAGDILAVSGG